MRSGRLFATMATTAGSGFQASLAPSLARLDLAESRYVFENSLVFVAGIFCIKRGTNPSRVCCLQ
jgi:hypothetical protein